MPASKYAGGGLGGVLGLLRLGGVDTGGFAFGSAAVSVATAAACFGIALAATVATAAGALAFGFGKTEIEGAAPPVFAIEGAGPPVFATGFFTSAGLSPNKYCCVNNILSRLLFPDYCCSVSDDIASRLLCLRGWAGSWIF